MYNEMILLHEVVEPLNGIQKKLQEITKLLNVANIVVDLIQEGGDNYPNVSEKLVRKEKLLQRWTKCI